MERTFISAIAAVAVMVSALPVTGGESNKCTESVQACINHMAERMAHAGWIGVEYEKVEKGLKINKVVDDSPAKKAGIKPGDILIAINGAKCNDMEAMRGVEKYIKVGNTVTVTIFSPQGEEKELKVTLGKFPEDIKARWIGQHILDDHTEASVN